MGQVKFGMAQLDNPTPSNRSKPIDMFCAVAGVLIAWTTTAGFIPSEVSNVIASILGLLIGVGQAIKPFFGVVTRQQEVPSEDVSTMDTKPNNN